MKQEVSSAVNFLTDYLSSNTELSHDQIELFGDNLEYLITERFQNHWHPNSPLKGNAYRCLNVDSTTVDPVIVKASYACGISPSKFQELFPDGLALWIDPRDVCYRIGKRLAIKTIYGHSDQASYTSTPYQHCSPSANYSYYKNQYNWYNSQYPYLQTTQVF